MYVEENGGRVLNVGGQCRNSVPNQKYGAWVNSLQSRRATKKSFFSELDLLLGRKGVTMQVASCRFEEGNWLWSREPHSTVSSQSIRSICDVRQRFFCFGSHRNCKYQAGLFGFSTELVDRKPHGMMAMRSGHVGVPKDPALTWSVWSQTEDD